MTRISEEYLSRLENLHRQVDDVVAPLVESLGPKLVCHRGCSDCCQDDLTVFEIEAELINSRCGDLLSTGRPGPVGGCAFLDSEGACRVYPWRPYVCRTQGLPLRWFEGTEGNIEGRDICPLNLQVLTDQGEQISELPEEEFWTIGPWEGKLASLQAEASGCFVTKRVFLRSLFQVF